MLVKSEDKAFNVCNKIKGAKKHMIVDTFDLVLAEVIRSECIQDKDGAVVVVMKLLGSWKNIIKIFASGGYKRQLI